MPGLAGHFFQMESVLIEKTTAGMDMKAWLKVWCFFVATRPDDEDPTCEESTALCGRQVVSYLAFASS